MGNNISKVQLTDTIDFQRRRINEAVDIINNMRDGILEVANEAALPTPTAATSNIYLIRYHTKYKGTVLALLNANSYVMVPLRNNPINANHYRYYTANDFGTGVTINKLVYLDSNKIWQLADCSDESKKAMGIVGPFNSIILSGLVQSAGLNLVPGTVYYYDNTGNLTDVPTIGYVGYALDNDLLDVSIKEKVQIPQSDFAQTDTTAVDYIKNKPGVVSKQANGFVPQLPNETSVNKFFRQDGTWAVPNYPTPGVQKTGDAMTGTLPDTGAAQVRNITILTQEGSSGNDGWIYGVIEA